MYPINVGFNNCKKYIYFSIKYMFCAKPKKENLQDLIFIKFCKLSKCVTVQEIWVTLFVWICIKKYKA